MEIIQKKIDTVYLDLKTCKKIQEIEVDVSNPTILSIMEIIQKKIIIYITHCTSKKSNCNNSIYETEV